MIGDLRVKPLLTIFTPTFNREELLPNLYTSLIEQKNYNFLWMIIDDGSTDKTEELVQSWIKCETRFLIQYYKKENGGLQSAYVEAISHLETDLAMCIDSDDCAMPDAVDLVEKAWRDCENKRGVGGFLGLDCYKSREILGGRYPEEIKMVSLIDLSLGKIKRTAADRALVVRSDLYKQTTPAKQYPGERTMNATYLHLQIGEKYPFVIINEPLIQVEYQVDGLSKNKKKHYVSAPNTYADWRLYMLQLKGGPFKFYYRNAIHYVSSCIFAKRQIFSRECSHKWIVFLAIPPGIALNLYLRRCGNAAQQSS